jgi:hypothetical protein
MNQILFKCIVVGLLALAGGPTQAQETPFAKYGCTATDRACMIRAIRAHPAQKLETWESDRTKPVTQRIHVAPPVLLAYMLLENVFQGFKEVPRAPTLDATFMHDIEAAVREMPPQVLRAIDKKLVGIYLVDDLGGTGFTDIVLDSKGRPAGGYVLLDAAVLSRYTANAWATWKENTPFKPDPAWQLKARIEDDDADNRKNAIQYILLHELGHVLSIDSDIHPPFWLAPREVASDRSWPFFDLSWSTDRAANNYRAYPGHDFAQRKRVVYYLGAKLEGAEMQATYEALARTNFPTLYAATRPADDFAEAFVKYVHVRLLGRPWEITLWRDGVNVKTVASCWGKPRCAAKEAYLRRLLANPS